MSLITTKEFAEVLHLKKWGGLGNFTAWLLLKILRFSALNRIYDRNKHLEGNEFLEALLADFSVTYEISEEDLKRIPVKGAFISVSNHPLGGIDGILLLKILQEMRPDSKLAANFLLQKIRPMAPYIIGVDPFDNRKDVRKNAKAIQQCLSHLKQGYCLGVFPAGEVSTQKEGNIYTDKEWEIGVAKIIQRANVPVLPIYFHAKNSRFFYLLAKISGHLRTAKLPSELLNKKNKRIKIRIGQPISVTDQTNYQEAQSLLDFIRKKTYMLANVYATNLNPLHSAREKLKLPKSPKKIVKPKKEPDVIAEVDRLRNSGNRLLAVKNYEVFFAPAKRIPHLLYEIGRLREITFREVGEGTLKAIDLDKFDNYYYHLFLWDNAAETFVGAYRMGLGKEIFPKYGIKGFYICTLFDFEPELYKLLSESIEMGRAFIIKEYQQRPMPLFLLWKGIINVTIRYPENKYLIGGVSISNQFSNFSKSLMIEFMKSHYYDPFVAQYIQPKKEYKVVLKDADKDFIFDAAQADMKKFDKFINEIEPNGLRIPVLIKKYLQQNARLVAFNVDPKFNNSVDGLMYIRIDDLPESTVQPVMEEFQKELLNKGIP